MGAAWETSPPFMLIGVISGQGLTTIDWALNLAALQKPAAVSIRCWKGLPYDVARNRVIKDARELGCRFVFFLDSDVIAPFDTIAQLLSQNVPIVSGLYWSKKGNPGMWKRAPDRDSYNPIVSFPSSSLVEVDAIGAGCLLIDLRVFETLDKMGLPWFEWQITDPMQQEGVFSEDFAFGRYAQQAGYHLYCYTGIQCNHEWNVAYTALGKVTGDKGL